MSRLKKSIGVFVTLILLIITGALMLTNIKAVLMPAQLRYLRYFGFIPKPTGFLKTAVSNYLFWLALIVFVILLLILLVIIFYPKNKTELALEDNKGKLILKSSAVDGLVKSVVTQKGYMNNPKVTTSLSKKKLKVSVKGDIIPRQAIVAKSEQMKADITQALQNFIGLNQPLKLQVEVSGIESNGTSAKTKSRVE